MYDSNETIWFSQPLLHFKDKNYGSEGSIQVYISFNTNDFTRFSSPNFCISLKNNRVKTLQINYSNACELFETIEEIFRQATVNGTGLQIDRKYSKNDKLHISFYKENDERVVKVILQGSETDLISVVITLKPQFVSIIRCLKSFTENYFRFCSDLALKTVDTRFFKTFESIPNIIKTLPSQIISQIPQRPSDNLSHSTNIIPSEFNIDYSASQETKIDPVIVQEAKNSENIMQDFSTFIGKDLDNVKVDLIKEPYVEPKKEIDYQGVFVNKMLNNDLQNFEMILNNIKMDEKPILALAEKIKETISGDDEKFTMFPGINEDDLKSIVYLSTLTFREGELSNIKHNKPIPVQTPIARYNPTIFPEKNMNIVYDLFLITIFMKIYRRRIESKTSDPSVIMANFYFQLRCFCDCFIFSFLDKIEKDNFKSLIMTRFSNYEKIQFFSKYQDLLNNSI